MSRGNAACRKRMAAACLLTLLLLSACGGDKGSSLDEFANEIEDTPQPEGNGNGGSGDGDVIQPEPAPANLPETRREPTESSPDEGSLEELIEEQVGEFTLADGRRFPELIQLGATDGAILLYESNDGVSLTHSLGVFGSADLANEIGAKFAGGWEADGYVVVDSTDVLMDGEPVGVVLVLEKDDQIVIWTNDNLLSIVVGPRCCTIPFFEALPY